MDVRLVQVIFHCCVMFANTWWKPCWDNAPAFCCRSTEQKAPSSAKGRDRFQWSALCYTALCCFQGLLQSPAARGVGISWKGSCPTARLAECRIGLSWLPPDHDGCLWCLEGEHSTKLHHTIEYLCHSTRTQQQLMQHQHWGNRAWQIKSLRLQAELGAKGISWTVTSSSQVRVAWAFHPITCAEVMLTLLAGTKRNKKPWLHYFSTASASPRFQK